MQKEKARMGYIFIIPSIVLVLVFIIYPVINTINMSFHDIRIQTLAEGKKFVGFDNYIKLLSDQTFFDTLKFTLLFYGCCCNTRDYNRYDVCINHE